MNKQPQQIIMLIMTCEKYAHKAAYQRATWLPTVPDWLVWFHVLGNPRLDVPFRFDMVARRLTVRTPDDYNSLPKKVIAAYAAVEATFDFSYVFKTDDDQMLMRPPALFDTLRGVLAAAKPHYGGKISEVKQAHISQYWRFHRELPRDLIIQAGTYCTGRFYVLSRWAVCDLIVNRAQIEAEYFEDYAIGRYLHPNLKANMKNFDTESWFADIDPVYCCQNA